MKRKKNEKFEQLERAQINEAIHNMSAGNLDIFISEVETEALKATAKDINNISITLNNYISEISKVLSHLSVGDLTISVAKDVKFKGNFNTIKTALKKMSISLNTVFDRLDTIINKIEYAFGECTEQTHAVSENASTQAQEIQEINQLINEINHIVDENILTVTSFSASIEHVKAESVRGREKMNAFDDSMSEMEDSANAIQEIIILISNISNKTKLLALNASIEAARAGESGRGFAVVASEIGTLASQTSSAVSKTTELVEQTLHSVNHSNILAKETTQMFQNIYEAIDTVSHKSIQIASSANKQAESIKNMFQIIDHLSEMGSQNAKLAEESVVSLSQVQAETDLLKQLLATFILEGNSNHLLLDAAGLKESAFSLIETMKGIIFDVPNINRILEQHIQKQKYVECIYIINAKGIQVSDTVMNPSLKIASSENFSPAEIGFDHSEKRYLRQALLLDGEIFESHEYISSATGGLCKTYAVLCKNNTEEFVLCIDMMCMLQVS